MDGFLELINQNFKLNEELKENFLTNNFETYEKFSLGGFQFGNLIFRKNLIGLKQLIWGKVGAITKYNCSNI